jgi:hypothetical protein
MKYLTLLGELDWANFPERPTTRPWPGPPPQPRAPYVAAYLVKIAEGHKYMSTLYDFLVAHPALVWLLGFELKADPGQPYGFDVAASAPGRKQLGRVLRALPNAALQFLLTSSVQLIRQALPAELGPTFGQTVALDVTVILAWVAENNPKAYIKEADRLNAARQPRADRDCKLGCKKKVNRSPEDEPVQASAAPQAKSPPPKKRPTNFSAVDLYYWGYGSGVAATSLPELAEVVLAEHTQPFNRDDITYFQPLMAGVEARLGFPPPFGAADGAFDAFYTFDYFHAAGGLAAIPYTGKKSAQHRAFSADGLPLCPAGLPMPSRSTLMNYRGLVPQHQANHACPLVYPEPTGKPCPINHPKAAQGGCVTRLGTSPGARLRYTLDRHSPAYKQVYHQRSATERVNAQAKELGLEHPKLRSGPAIANQNTLTYILVNLRALGRLQARLAERPPTA